MICGSKAWRLGGEGFWALTQPFPDGKGLSFLCLGDGMSDEVVESVAVAVEVPAEVAVLRARLVQSELKAAAIRAGMVDLDGIKLVDMTQVALTEAGEVADGAAVMAALRVAKPFLFGSSSSSAATVPRAEAPKAKAAMEMSVEEWRAARAALVRRR